MISISVPIPVSMPIPIRISLLTPLLDGDSTLKPQYSGVILSSHSTLALYLRHEHYAALRVLDWIVFLYALGWSWHYEAL